MYVNCSLTRIGKVEQVILSRTASGEWDVALHVECGGQHMVLSRTSQTHMFFLPETQAKIKSLFSVMQEFDDEETKRRETVSYVTSLIAQAQNRPIDWREGQAAYNVLSKERPDLASQINGTDLDPFYDNERLPAFYDWVASNA